MAQNRRPIRFSDIDVNIYLIDRNLIKKIGRGDTKKAINDKSKPRGWGVSLSAHSDNSAVPVDMRNTIENSIVGMT
jgi:hypothetical protein